MERDERVTMEEESDGERRKRRVGKKKFKQNETVRWKTEVEWRRMEKDSWRENQIMLGEQ